MAALRRAVIDLGSNSVKLTIADVTPIAGGDYAVATLKTQSWITRLGRELAVRHQSLHPTSVEDTLKAITEMRSLLDTWKVEGVFAVATSALRDAFDRDLVVVPGSKILGHTIQIISGHTEALLSTQGAAACAQKVFGQEDFFYIDVGGASTEISVLNPKHEGHSYQAGAVRCHEALGLDHIPVTDPAWSTAQHDIAQFFPMQPWMKPASKPKVVAVGGSLLLAARIAGAQSHDGVGMSITRTMLKQINDKLRKLTLQERLALPGMVHGRADILCAGILCLTHAMDMLQVEDALISDWGLRHGLLRSWKLS